MFRFLKRKRVAIPAALVLGLVFAGVAFAIWTLTQSTSAFQAQAGSGTSSPLVITTPTSYATTCYPGTSCDLYAKVSNPSTAPVTITAWAASAPTSWNSAGCPATSAGWSGPVESTTPVTLTPAIVVPAGASNVTINLPNAISLTANAPQACAGGVASFAGGATINLTETIGS